MSHISTNLSYLLRQLVPLYNIYAPNQRHLSEWSYAWVISHMIPSSPARMQYMTSVTVHHAYNESVRPAYNPSFSACFSVGTVFFSHNKSANSVFQPAYQLNRTGPISRAFL
jgi:hypothetical protein